MQQITDPRFSEFAHKYWKVGKLVCTVTLLCDFSWWGVLLWRVLVPDMSPYPHRSRRPGVDQAWQTRDTLVSSCCRGLRYTLTSEITERSTPWFPTTTNWPAWSVSSSEAPTVHRVCGEFGFKTGNYLQTVSDKLIYSWIILVIQLQRSIMCYNCLLADACPSKFPVLRVCAFVCAF